MRRAQDLAVSVNPDSDTWAAAADRVEDLVALLEPHQAAEGVGPANRVPSLPGAGSLLMPPWHVTKFESDGVELTVQFSRFHVGGNQAVHGGVLPLLFDSVFGMVIHATGRPISRTAFLHVDYRRGDADRHSVDGARLAAGSRGSQGVCERRSCWTPRTMYSPRAMA